MGRTPVAFTPLKSEPLLRLLIADLVGEEVTRESIGTLREDIADLRVRVDENGRPRDELPHREKYLLIAIALPAAGCSTCTTSTSTRSSGSSGKVGRACRQNASPART